jgi:prolyl-tRNA editing enzyme YbaK/EbsC (Cys-tRNA(Pro) deacylase)
MTIATSVQDCLAREGVHYDMIAHERTRDSNHTAQAAHIPGDRLAKCVMPSRTPAPIKAGRCLEARSQVPGES